MEIKIDETEIKLPSNEELEKRLIALPTAIEKMNCKLIDITTQLFEQIAILEAMKSRITFEVLSEIETKDGKNIKKYGNTESRSSEIDRRIGTDIEYLPNRQEEKKLRRELEIIKKDIEFCREMLKVYTAIASLRAKHEGGE